jgi:hypothetical protein
MEKTHSSGIKSLSNTEYTFNPTQEDILNALRNTPTTVVNAAEE